MKAHWLYLLFGLLFSIWIAFSQGNSAGQISGTVEDPTSAHIAGAFITLISLDRVLQTESTSDGSFQFEDLAQGVYAIEITAPGFAKKTIPVTLQSNNFTETISVVLNVGNMPDMEKCGRDVSIKYEGIDAMEANLTGTLRDYFRHKLIPKAEIKIVSESNRQALVIVRTDRAGQFTVKHLAPDYYDIQISCKNYNLEELRHVAIPRENKVLIESTLRKRNQIAICQ